jgi:hypothetical protein
MRAGNRFGMIGIAVVAAMLVVGCGGGDAQALCSATQMFTTSDDDARDIVSSQDADEIHAATERFQAKLQSSIATLRGIKGQDLTEIAGRLADQEEKLVPILDQLRNAKNETAWKKVRLSMPGWSAVFNGIFDDAPDSVPCK